MFSNAKYLKSPVTQNVSCICVDINGITSFVPLDPANTDYQNLMKLVDEGELIIQEAPVVETE